MIGRVVSTKMNNTATVLVEREARNPLYKKTYVQTKKYLVDTIVTVKDGDMVEIVKVRPVSKNKHWKVVKVVGKDLEAITEEKLKAAAEQTIAEVMPEEKEESRVENQESSKEVSKKEKVSKARKEKTSH
ncbi:mitochondrial small ribosomal subunit protein uS17m [Candidatus Daviesbacteria bacterium]|nr:mitochondrial small ribosomal subunit protein uS17m [Candidatus Daviesbacteria bacterium]